MRRPLLLLLALVLSVATAAPAGAHVEVRESDPAANDTAREGLDAITITFLALDTAEPVDVEVTDPAGTDVTAGAPEVDARTSVVRVPTDPLEPGQHIVHWHAVSDDGDGQSEGTFTFTVEEGAGGGVGIWVVWIVALAIPALIFLRPGARERS